MKTPLKSYGYTLPALAFLIGLFLGAIIMRTADTREDAKAKMVQPTVAFLLHDGTNTRTWNGVTVNEGESIADIIDRIANIEHIELSWKNSGRTRELISLSDKASTDKTWHCYVNGALISLPLGRFYPKKGDIITMIYGAQ